MSSQEECNTMFGSVSFTSTDAGSSFRTLDADELGPLSESGLSDADIGISSSEVNVSLPLLSFDGTKANICEFDSC